MKQKLRNLSASANIIFAILAVFIFIAPLQWSGKVLGLIPGMEKADDYLLQAIVETVVLVIFLGITYIFGLWDIFKEGEFYGSSRCHTVRPSSSVLLVRN